ncbi:MAG: phenylalanine--tRNA ligase subunit beta [Candidatus Magasanikbacteria bacterium]
MLISKNWLQEFVFLPDSLTPEELADGMTMKTVEVEGVEHQGSSLEKIVLGAVTAVEKHPDADKLLVCQVDAGKEKVQVVCGGLNVKKGMKVALGKIGASVHWHGEGDPIVLKKTKIRGVESFGMICASDEIGLGSLFPKQDEKEILDLSHIEAETGTPLAEALELNDIVLDIDNKSMTHRPDLWGHYGMARELAAIYHKKLQDYSPKEIKIGKGDKKIDLVIENQEEELCPRYSAVALENVTVGPSPDWMQKRLLAVGLRPINNLVDITNYVMLELGQPMHCFDIEQLTTNNEQLTIEIRKADKGEEFEALDEKNYELTEDMLVISHTGKVIALAGVIGGQESSVSEDTSSIVFESANFDSTSVRRTATALGVRTDSSARFEKSLDPVNTELALRKAVQLTLELCPEARVVSAVADTCVKKKSVILLEVSLELLHEKIGTDIPKKQIVEILENLGFGIKIKKNTISVQVPSWRATKDISIPEDIVEEVARIYGYDNIPEQLPRFSIEAPEKNKLLSLARSIRESLALEHTLTETRNYSYVSPDWLAKIGIDSAHHIALENPIAKDRPLLRRSLLPNMLEHVEANLHRFEAVKLFEVGRTYILEEAGERADSSGDDLLPRQDTVLGIVYAQKGDGTPFFVVSNILKNLFLKHGVELSFVPSSKHVSYIHPGRSADLLVWKELIGSIFELDPGVQDTLGIPYRTAFAEVHLDRILDFCLDRSRYSGVPQFPSVTRDIALLVSRDVSHRDITTAIKDADELISEVELFDVFGGKGIPDGKKSMAYHIEYRATDRTLRTATVDKVHAKVVNMLEKDFGGEKR